MMNLLLALYPLMLLVLIFYGVKVSPKGEFSKEYLSLGQADMMRAFSCVAIVLHHLVQQITAYGTARKGIITIFNHTGILFTATFFFFSGYGLVISVYKKDDYLDEFLKRRLPKVLIPFWCINLMGIILTAFYGVHYTPVRIFTDLFGITLVNSNGWYIIEIVILYLIFYVLFKTVGKKDAAFTLLAIAAFIMIVFSASRGHDPVGRKSEWFRGEWWYNSTAVFVFGMIYARFKDAITAFLQKRYRMMLAIVLPVTAVLVRLSIFATLRFGYYTETTADTTVTLVIQSLACLFYVLLILLFNMKAAIGNRALAVIGGMSIELFLIHGFFVHRVFANVRMNDFARLGVVLICSFAAAAITAPVTGRLAKKTCALLCRKKTYNDTLEGEAARLKDMKRKKVIAFVLPVLFLTLLIIYLLMTFGSFLYAKSEYNKEIRALGASSAGDEVLWGRYETDPVRPGKERLSWTVLEKEPQKVCLISRYGIAGSVYNREHKPVTYKDSGIRQFINSEEFISIFSRYEIKDMIECEGDLVTLLTPEEAGRLFESDTDRELLLTKYAEISGTNINRKSKVNNWDMKGYRSSWWWLKGPESSPSVYAPVVTVDGVIQKEEQEVNRPGGAVRPVIWIRIQE